MSRESSERIVVSMLILLLAVTAPSYAVAKFKTSNYAGGHQIWFEAEDFDERNPADDTYYPVVDEAGAFGKAITRAGGAGGMIRWTFDISSAGGKAGTWYFWGRVINPGNTSDFMIVEGDPGDPPVPSGPPFPGTSSATQFSNSDRIFEETAGSPGNWVWSRSDHGEAHTKQLKDGANSMYVFHRQGDNTVFWDVFVWSDDPAYVPTDADYQNAKAPVLGKASGPNPADGATDVPRDVVLTWKPGIYAAALNGHRVFFGTAFSDVNNATVGTTQSGASYTPPQPLTLETTYYWRVDEVNAPPSSTVYRGSVWSFTTEPVGYPISGANIIATASSSGSANFGPENTINGSGLNANDQHSVNVTDMWVSSSEPLGAWIQYEFDAVNSLYQMWVWNGNQAFEGTLGLGLKTVTVEYSTDGANWTVLAGVPEFAKAPGTVGYEHNTTVDFGGAPAKYVKLTATSNWGGILPQYNLSEVRFLTIPLSARQPNPASGATDVAPETVLTWRAGRQAARHDVYLSTDQQAVIDGTAPVVTVTSPSYSATLDLGSTYYWRVAEVNEAESPAISMGNIWSFSTAEYLAVEDFESYNDIDPPDAESHRIFESWIDGFGITTNGALVGYDPPQPSYAETTIVHGGGQAMPLFYSNTAGAASSEATRTFATPQNWTKYGIKTLGLWFHGAAGNTGQLYVKINGVKIPYDGSAGNLAGAAWQPWNIDLTSAGVNLQSVSSMTIGVEGNGAAGTLYVDDVRLYAYPRELVTPVQPNAAGLMAHYPLDGNANDIAGGHNGTASAGVSYAPGKIGQALKLNGNDYVDCGNPTQLDFGTGDWTVAAWINMATSMTGPNIIFSNGGDDSGGIRYVLSMGQSADHTITLTVDDNATKVESIGKVVVDDGQWHHVIGLRKGTSLRVYVDSFQDGADVTVAAGYNLAGTSQANAFIGAGYSFANKVIQKFYTGTIDDVRIYNYALSDAEIAGLVGKTQPFDKPF